MPGFAAMSHICFEFKKNDCIEYNDIVKGKLEKNRIRQSSAL
jgi:hypothetical protein